MGLVFSHIKDCEKIVPTICIFDNTQRNVEKHNQFSFSHCYQHEQTTRFVTLGGPFPALLL
jgi:hypothetical protein